MKDHGYLVVCILCILIIVGSCCEENNRYKEAASVQQTYTYECIDKKEAVGSHYNLFTGKQVVESEYFIIFRSTQTSDVVTHQVTLKEFYTYNIGSVYRFNHQLY